MRYVLDIARGTQDGPRFRQSFVFETDNPEATVATALTELGQREPLLDIDGSAAEPVRWECSCLQRRCGACAMLIDGHPALACDIKLASRPSATVRLDPLRKFPLVEDLIVDRSAIFEGLAQIGSWLEEEATVPAKRAAIAQEASRCLQCGCCLEVCPGFILEGPFRGASAMMSMARLLAEANPAERKRLAKSYRAAFYGGCAKSLACKDVCPAKLDIEKLASRSNAAAVWGRF